jgi:hypothetical protein
MSYTRGPLPRYWHSIDTLTHGPVAPQAGTSAAAWPSADLAIYVPVAVERRVIVKQLWYANQQTGTGNYDIGLYDSGGTQLLGKGSTAKGTSEAEIVWDCTDTTIGPGIYYLALVSSNNTDTFQRLAPAAPILAALGVYSEASALPLPVTATFAVPQTLAYIPVVGMYLDTRVT